VIGVTLLSHVVVFTGDEWNGESTEMPLSLPYKISF
jgi:hypothetical protein